MKTKIIIASCSLVAVAFVGVSSTNAAINQGNGYKSNNWAKELKNKKTSIYQTNFANQSSYVDVMQNAGGNQSNENTDGDVEVLTGEAHAHLSADNSANQNEALLTTCDCQDDNSSAQNLNNGAKSNNKAVVKNKRTLNATQSNVAFQKNAIKVAQNTGNNKANSNTGSQVSIDAGDTTVKVITTNTANTNTLVIE